MKLAFCFGRTCPSLCVNVLPKHKTSLTELVQFVKKLTDIMEFTGSFSWSKKHTVGFCSDSVEFCSPQNVSRLKENVSSPVVTICTAQWSLYVPYSGQYMYRTVVTVCTAQWSLYVPYSGHYMYHQFNIQQSHVLPTQCFVRISEQTAIISLYRAN
jgi:hypothetical protein